MKRYISLILWIVLSASSVFAQKKQISLEDIWQTYAFFPQYVESFSSMNDGMHYSILENGEINQYAYESGEKTATLLGSNQLKDLNINGYQFSNDENKVLFSTDVEQIYRYSTQENNYIFNRADGKITPLSDGGKQRYATFSPQGDKVAFVRNNNLYIKDLNTQQENAITKDGKVNEIINGATDWVYEEEFAFDKAFFWSPDGSKIAFYRFDESKVKEFTMELYKNEVYPELVKFKYPKAGEENAKVTLHLYDLATQQIQKIDLGQYEYIPRVKWTNTTEFLSAITLNRHQNDLKLYLINTANNNAKVILNETSDTYIDITDDLTFLPDNKTFVWTSDKSGYNHLYTYNMDGKDENQITRGNWEVTKFYGVDDNNTLYFQVARTSPINREVYAYELKKNTLRQLPLKEGYNEAQFSKGMKYYINTHQEANQPPKVALYNMEGKELRVMVDNAALAEKLGEYDLGKKEFFTLPSPNGEDLNAWMIKPANFDANKKYPVLMFVYGGPSSQTVENTWDPFNDMWYQMLAQKGYIIVSVDNHGTGARGAKFKKMTYKELGKIEAEDQIAAAKQLSRRAYIDGSRIGIWGWSYGGYLSSLCMFKGKGVFKTGIAVAPVSNWKFYDSIYTERYMQTPQENSGYDENSPISHVDGLKGNYLLVHGTADDNVHFQNSVELVAALQKAGKQFDLMIYPNKNHGIYGGNTRLHLYQLMTDYLLENL
ncbi:MAG: S9 family peptidase [Chitinophagales bacterium]|nr:S9 family peptidase [Bacteroidota bacterium]MCB9043158.1 S9 family peptidase [Chitinophagales bacterium]